MTRPSKFSLCRTILVVLPATIATGCSGTAKPESGAPAPVRVAAPSPIASPAPVESPKGGWAAGPISTDDEAVEATRTAFAEVRSKGSDWSLRNRDGSTSVLNQGRLDSLSRIIAMDDEGIFYHKSVECAALADQLRDPDGFYADARVHGAFLYGGLEDVPPSGTCRSVQVDAGFDGIVLGFQPSDGRLLFIFHSPEDDTAG